MIGMKDNLAVILKRARATDELTMCGTDLGVSGLPFGARNGRTICCYGRRFAYRFHVTIPRIVRPNKMVPAINSDDPNIKQILRYYDRTDVAHRLSISPARHQTLWLVRTRSVKVAAHSSHASHGRRAWQTTQPPGRCGGLGCWLRYGRRCAITKSAYHIPAPPSLGYELP